MTTLLKQEYYKLRKQRSNAIFIIGVLVLQIITALYSLKYPQVIAPKDLFMNSFFAYPPVILFFIAISSTSITKERQFGTLRALLYRKFSYTQVLISKVISLVSYALFSLLLTSIFSIILKFLLFRDFSITKSIWKQFLLTSLDQFLTLIFLMSLVILLGTIINNSNFALTTGIIGYFAINIFNQILLFLVAKFNWLKWNPLNMMNLGAQLQNHNLHKMTQLSLPVLSIGYTFYILLFLGLALYSFRKRNV